MLEVNQQEIARRRRRSALLWALGAFVVCSWMPWWVLWLQNPIEGYYQFGPLWWVLWNVALPDTGPQDWRRVGAGGYYVGGTVTAIAMPLAALFGYRTCGRIR